MGIIKPIATRDSVLEYSQAIFQHYFGNFIIKKRYLSPLRNENTPSFNIYIDGAGNFKYKDFGMSSGNAIDFVMQLYNLTFIEALIKIVVELNLPFRVAKSHGYSNVVNSIKMKKDIKITKKEFEFKPVFRRNGNKPYYTEFDIHYWTVRHKIKDIRYLLKHRIYSAKELNLDSTNIWTATINNPIYIYVEYYKNKAYYKAYRPLEKDKWRSNYPNSLDMIHNIDKLNMNSEEVIITKSNKDSVILDSLGFNVCNTQGEDMPIPKDRVEWFHKNFKNIYLFYDNDYNKSDNYGRINMNKYADEYDFKQIVIPDGVKMTDTGDIIQTFSRHMTKYLINKWKND